MTQLGNKTCWEIKIRGFINCLLTFFDFAHREKRRRYRRYGTVNKSRAFYSGDFERFHKIGIIENAAWIESQVAIKRAGSK